MFKGNHLYSDKEIESKSIKYILNQVYLLVGDKWVECDIPSIKHSHDGVNFYSSEEINNKIKDSDLSNVDTDLLVMALQDRGIDVGFM